MTFCSSTSDLDQQSLHSDPDESYLRDLPEFPSVEELPSVEHNLLHFPPRQHSQGDGAQARASSEREQLSPASLLIQHLASPLHFVNTHFNGHGRPPGGEVSMSPAEGVGGEVDGQRGDDKVPVAHDAQQSLEALSEEIVSTAISTVVQNTLSAMLRSSEASEEPTLAEFLPTEIQPNVLETSTSTAACTKTTTVGALELDEDLDEAGNTEEIPDDTLVPTEEEDFELLDQSELEQVDEVLDLSSDIQVVGGASRASDTPPPPQDQPQS